MTARHLRLASLALAALWFAAPGAAQQRVEPGSWFDILDVPRPLLEQLDRGGKVAIAVKIGTDGKPRDCTIITSSTIPELDALTCNLVERRGRYLPAIDAAGNAVIGSDRLSVDWRLLAPPPPPVWQLSSAADALLTNAATFKRMNVAATGNMRFAIAMAPGGRAAACAVTRSSGTPAFDARLCRKILDLRSVASISPPFESGGTSAFARHLGLELTWQIRPGGASFTTYPTAYPGGIVP